MASPGRFHSSGNCFQPITGFLLTFINWAFFCHCCSLSIPIAAWAGRVSLIPAQEQQLLSWEHHKARAGGELLLPMEASPASSHSPSAWGGSRGLVEAGSEAAGGHCTEEFPKYLSLHLTRNKTCGKTALALGLGAKLPASLPQPCVLHQPGAATGPTETALSPGTTKAGQMAREPGELCPHSPSCSLWDLALQDKQKKTTAPAPSSHTEPQQIHPGEERMGTYHQLAHRAALERSHFPFAA